MNRGSKRTTKARQASNSLYFPSSLEYSHTQSRVLALKRDFMMNVVEFVERREAVREPVWLDKLLTLCISPSSLKYSHTRLRVLALTLTRDFLVNVSKFVERREAVKEQLRVDKLLTSCIFTVESQVHACARTSTC